MHVFFLKKKKTIITKQNKIKYSKEIHVFYNLMYRTRIKCFKYYTITKIFLFNLTLTLLLTILFIYFVKVCHYIYIYI